MTKELITRGELKGIELHAPWLLVSGRPDPRLDRTGLPGRAIMQGIQLYVQDAMEVVKLDLDVHDAGDLYAALEAHMENVAAPPAPDFRESNLEAIREEIANPLTVREDGVDAEFLGAMADVVEAWTNNGPHADPRHPVRTAGVEGAFPALAAALDRLAALNA